ncbi:10343_t:CDS:2, partial [Racocetra persica]
MTSKPHNFHVKIPIEEANKKISKIACSPNMKHVAALHEDNYVSLWSIDSQRNHLENEKTIKIYTKAIGERIFAISDYKHVAISLDRNKPYNFKIFDFKKEKEVLLKFPDWQKEIDFLSFIDNGNIIM